MLLFKEAAGFAIGSLFLVSSLVSPLRENASMTQPGLGFPSPSPTNTIEIVQSRQSSKPAASSTTEYLPRKLYPGTYGEFCGPTPEVLVTQSCAVHGWHSDKPRDRVDEACEMHDIAYCQCESELLARRNAPLAELPMLSSMTALRFATKPALTRALPVDNEYFDCINKADRQIITTGIQVRSEMQRSGCSLDPSLSWFCDLDQGTLGVFEKVNLDIFLRDLDFDERPSKQVALKKLEKKRQQDLTRELQQGKNLAEAASSGPVQEDEQEMLQRLLGPQ